MKAPNSIKHNGKYVAYYRVSTDKQGKDGLGIEAQKAEVQKHLNGGQWTIIADFTEVETGKRNDRPELAKALRACRLRNATLIVAKLDRLARNARFLLTLVEESGDRGVVFCDLPAIPEGPTGKFLLASMANVAELEAGLISKRTKEALAVKKAQLAKEGKRLGTPYPERIAAYTQAGVARSAKVRGEKARRFALDLLPMVEEMRERGITGYNALAKALNDEGQPAPRGGLWTGPQLMQVLRLVERAEVA